MITTRRFLELYLAFLSRLTLARFRPKIIAVTGSVGKTTTTTVIDGLLTSVSESKVIGEFRSNARNNMNGTVGVFLTVLGSNRFVGPDRAGVRELARLTWKTLRMAFNPGSKYPAVLLLECGISSKGEMGRIARVIRPDVVIVTTVGHAHMEKGMPTVSDIAKEKSQLVLACKRGGLVLLGADNEWSRGMAQLTRSHVKLVEGRGVTFGVSVARLIAEWLEIAGPASEALLENPATASHRLERIEGPEYVIIDDTFNANPLSMTLALDTLHAEKCSGRRIAVLGAMKELGTDSSMLHEQVGKYARDKADLVIGVGEEAARFYASDYHYADSGACADGIRDIVAHGDCLLVKGSHSVYMYRIVEALR